MGRRNEIFKSRASGRIGSRSQRLHRIPGIQMIQREGLRCAARKSPRRSRNSSDFTGGRRCRRNIRQSTTSSIRAMTPSSSTRRTDGVRPGHKVTRSRCQPAPSTTYRHAGRDQRHVPLSGKGLGVLGELDGQARSGGGKCLKPGVAGKSVERIVLMAFTRSESLGKEWTSPRSRQMG